MELNLSCRSLYYVAFMSNHGELVTTHRLHPVNHFYRFFIDFVYLSFAPHVPDSDWIVMEIYRAYYYI